MTTALFSSNIVTPSTFVNCTWIWEIWVCFSFLPEMIQALSSHTSRKWPQEEREVRDASQLQHFSGTTETGVYPFRKWKGVEPRSPYVLHNYINHWYKECHKHGHYSPTREGQGGVGRGHPLGTLLRHLTQSLPLSTNTYTELRTLHLKMKAKTFINAQET